MSAVLRPAEREDLTWLWPAVRAAQLFDHMTELEAHWAGGPWRVRVDSRGEAALLVRWRRHLDMMAIKGLWCSERRVGTLLADLHRVAREQSFTRVLSPLVPEESAGPYLDAGMEPVEEILILRAMLGVRRQLVSAEDAGDVELRCGTADDLAEVSAVDAAAFGDFWRYDHEMLSGYFSRERLGVAVLDGRVVGYTLCTVRRGEGSLGRLAVRPDLQGRGIGALLLEDALSSIEREGAGRVTLCTQSCNHRSRTLYAHAGFEELPGKLLGLVTVQP